MGQSARAAAALISVIGSSLAFYGRQLAFRAAAVLGLAIGAFGVTGLVSGCTLMVRETQIALENIAEEAAWARRQYGSSNQPSAR